MRLSCNKADTGEWTPALLHSSRSLEQRERSEGGKEPQLTVEFTTLGTVDLRAPNGRVIEDILRQPKRLALLAYLALARPHGFQRRDSLLALFWPELDTQRARASLRKALYVLRQSLGADALVGRGDEEVSLAADLFHCDAWAFEAALSDDHHEEALELYRGDLLEGFHAGDASPEFDDWLELERTRLRKQAAEAAWSVSRKSEERGDLEEAVRSARRAFSIAPPDEALLRRLLMLLDRVGDRAGALGAYDKFTAFLASEYEADPAPETVALIEAIRARTESSVEYTDATAPPGHPRTVEQQERFTVELAEGVGPANRSSHAARVPVAGPRRRSAVLTMALGVVFVTAVLYALYGAVNASSRVGGEDTNHLAVLYFENLSGDPAFDYLAYGLTEETIGRLGRLDRFTVTSRPAVRRFQGLDTEPAEIGRVLGVDYLVSGSVRRAEDRFRVTVELIRAGDGVHLWGESYESEESNLLAIEEDIARTVALQIAGELEPQDELLLATLPTEDASAYRHYLQGRYLMAERNPTSVARAITEFEMAADLDGSFGQALAAMGYGYALFIDWEWNYEGVSRDSLFALGFEAAERALRADSLSAEAWRIRGMLEMHRNPRDFTAASQAFQQAVAIDPSNATVLHSYATMQSRLGNLQAAAELEHRALSSEPGRPISLFTLSEVAYRSREYQQAVTWLDSALVVEPGFFFAYAFRGLAKLRLGDLDGARADGEISARFSAGVDVPGVTVVALTDVARGDRPSAVARLARLQRDISARGGGSSQDALWPAMIEVALGAHEAAVDRLEGTPTKSAEFAFWLLLPEFGPLRDDPRFRRLFEETRPRLGEPSPIA